MAESMSDCHWSLARGVIAIVTVFLLQICNLAAGVESSIRSLVWHA